MKDRWSQLSMSEKSDLMSLYIRNGISSLEEIKKHYNSYQDGGRLTFQQWKAMMKSKYPDIEMDNNKAGYNYEEYFNNHYDDAIKQLSNLQHFPDTYKLPNHPTFSNESIYSRGPVIGGNWVNDSTFTPSVINKQYYPNIYKEDRNYTEREIYNSYDTGGELGKVTTYGQWEYPYQVTTIPSNNITMKGVDYPVIGISNTGDTKYMLPNMDYLFDGQYVTEYPVHKFQRGGQHIPYEAKAKLSEDIMTQIWMPGYKRKYRDNVLLQAGPMQASFLLSGSDKDRYMLEHGYIKGQSGDYGLVKKAVGDNNYPVYQTAKDDEYRENLIPIANIMASDSHNWWGQETAKLRHAGSYPTTLYIDGRDPERFYQKAWDLNDYGNTRGTKSKMNLTGTLKANILDLVGNPAVQTSGYSKIDIDNLTSHHKPSAKQQVLQKHFENYLKDKNLTREILEDGTILYTHPEVKITGYKID